MKQTEYDWAYVYVIDVEIDTPSSFPAYVCVDETLSLGSTLTPDSAGGGTYSWTKATGPGTVTFSPSASAEDPSFSADQAGNYTVKVEYTKGGATVSDTSGTITVVEVDVVSADASNPNSTKINYQVNPFDTVVTLVSFTAPGTSDSKSNVSGSFYFTYDQSDVGWNSNTIRLEYCNSGIEDCTVTKTMVTNSGELTVSHGHPVMRLNIMMIIRIGGEQAELSPPMIRTVLTETIYLIILNSVLAPLKEDHFIIIHRQLMDPLSMVLMIRLNVCSVNILGHQMSITKHGVMIGHIQAQDGPDNT